MYKLDLPIDIKEKAAIERRRRAEKERQGRIFNARVRQIGVRTSPLIILKSSSFDFSSRSIKKGLINKFKIVIGWTN